MAEYLIISKDKGGDTVVRRIEATNINTAARALVAQGSAHDGFTGEIWRVAAPPKRITLKLTTSVEVDVIVAGEDE